MKRCAWLSRLAMVILSFLLHSHRPLWAFNWSGTGREWKRDEFGVAQVRVCIAESTFIGEAINAPGWVREKVEGTWGRWGNIRFEGWKTCTPADTANVIRLAIDGSSTFGPMAALGRSDSVPTKIELNFVAKCASSFFTSDQKACTQRLALRLFGRALGFGPEQARRENWPSLAPKYCTSVVPADQPDTPGWIEPVTFNTIYDVNSVMNACNSDALELSALDIVGLQAVYGRKASGSMVGRGGHNLEVPHADRMDGTLLWINDNAGTLEQRWAYDVMAGSFTALGRCLDGRFDNRYPAFISGCSSALRRWDFTAVDLRGLGAKCLERAGSLVELRACRTGAGTQEWTYTPQQKIVTGGGGTSALCLDTFSPTLGALGSGDRIVINTCRKADDPHQLFDLLSTGQIRARESRLCLDVEASNTDEGSPIQLYECKRAIEFTAPLELQFDLLNQQFNFAAGSTLRRKDNQFLDATIIGDDIAQPFVPVDLNSCNGNQNQVWEYYFLEPLRQAVGRRRAVIP
jgi:Ricin-type beta-trefoil lectin domain